MTNTAEQTPPQAEEPQAQEMDAIAEAQKQAADWKDKYLRAMADAENTRKRAQREVEDAHKYAVANFARDMLDVQDNLERALDAMSKVDADTINPLKEGVDMVANQLKGVFARFQIERVKTIGEKFNPDHHQAMFEAPTADHEPGTVTQEIQAGYTLAGRLLRPALVGVAKKAE